RPATRRVPVLRGRARRRGERGQRAARAAQTSAERGVRRAGTGAPHRRVRVAAARFRRDRAAARLLRGDRGVPRRRDALPGTLSNRVVHRGRRRHVGILLRRARGLVQGAAAQGPARSVRAPPLMANVESLLHGFAVALSGYHVLLMVVGVLLGILVGVLPGLGAPNGVTLLLALTFRMNPVSAIILLASMYWGALFGGSTTSILFNIPGEPSSVATTFDGHPMAKQGRATEALSYAFLSAAFGALFGVVVITLLAAPAAAFAHKFSSPEYFAVYFLAFACFIGLGGASPFKTLVSAGMGFSLAAVGMDTISGSLRLTFGLADPVKGRRRLGAL